MNRFIHDEEGFPPPPLADPFPESGRVTVEGPDLRLTLRCLELEGRRVEAMQRVGNGKWELKFYTGRGPEPELFDAQK